ncbi:MAG: VOC family protein [Gemmatimonadetes bacterium]|nr:VOC family protein [Gemmatimonadota bacterium]
MPIALRVAPYLPVADVAATVRFYRETLGFVVTYEAGAPPEFAIVARDGCAVMLRRVADPGRIVPVEAQGGTWDAFFWVDDATGLHAALAQRGARTVYGPVVQSYYNMLEFAIRDPDGHVLGFGQAL